MNILEEFAKQETGNDCVIHYWCAVVKLFDKYCVIEATKYEGGWILYNEPKISYTHFDSRAEAYKMFDEIVGDKKYKW